MFQITNHDSYYIEYNFYIVSVKGKMYLKINTI